MKFLKQISIAIILATALTGCAAKSVESTPKAAFTPTLDVDVAVAGDAATLQFKTNMIISKEHYNKERKEGEGHIHLSLDNGENQIITDSSTVLQPLSKGPHNIKVSLHNNDHTPYNVSKSLDIEVK
ncbi:hypothetical protein [Paenibacillus hexagrammi]|uniref:YtkA-like domain-containing protein n=1 Tax=Paenibacillus hexagrammi TaxID=2908839 RepID=A0ABY3SRX9_9BACL|nr:hypothetical protein [Paenibacillus sp. YPD9-1]UJF35860.1 hypothetical protein L0M14_12720 [Paenibacillus sp. YPD9-1]